MEDWNRHIVYIDKTHACDEGLTKVAVTIFGWSLSLSYWTERSLIRSKLGKYGRVT